jgi:hypothetical protein
MTPLATSLNDGERPVPQGLAELYAETIKSFNRAANDPEFDAWCVVLGGFKMPDIDAALRRWRCDTRVEDFTQRPIGARMPSPAEIKLYIEIFDRSNAVKFRPCNKNGCSGGFVKVYSGELERAVKLSDGTYTYEGNGSNKVDPKVGAVRRCQCFYDWAAQRRVQKELERTR